MVAPTDLAAAVLIVGLSLGGAYDLATREVPDNLWWVLGVVGAAIGALTIASEGALLSVVLWIVVAAYALQHFFPWTDRLSGRAPLVETAIEIALAATTIVIVGVSIALFGIGPAQVPYVVVATLVVTLVGRGLYETRILVGGADVKALIAMGVVLPIFPTSLLDIGSTSTAFLQVVPFAFNALVDAALLTLVVPLALAVRNLHSREFHWGGGFTTYSLAVDQLAHRFVWLDDPALPDDGGEREEETTEEDVTRRQAEADALRARGIARVRVTPQLPFVFFLALGAIVAVVAGNLLWDLVAAL